MPAGRPTTYTVKLVDEICERISCGETVIALCKEEGMPHQASIYKWLIENKEFSEKYARARERQADYFAEQIVALADEDPAVTFEDHEDLKTSRIDSGYVQYQRLRVDARKWFASKVAPKKYGDRSEVKLSGQVGLEQIIAAANEPET